MKKLSLSIIALFSITSLFAQEEEKEFAVSAELRPRAEYRNGAIYPREAGESPATFVNNRARLSLDYKTQSLQMKFSAQHVGVWGQDAPFDRNGRLNLNEAWARLNFGQGLFAKIGRQPLSYDDERLFGKYDWDVSGCWHDALIAGYENPYNNLHFILAYNKNDESIKGENFYDGSKAQPYKNMQTIWYRHSFQQLPLNISLLFTNIGVESGSSLKSDTKYMQTMGTYITFSPSNWVFSGTYYYQTGKTVTDDDISAFMASLSAKYNIRKKIVVGLGFDVLSGENEWEKYGEGRNIHTYQAFNPLFGSHHEFYGAMDYFYTTPYRNNYAPGLLDLHADFDFKASEKVDMHFSVHEFRPYHEPYRSGNTNTDYYTDPLMGPEIDYSLKWQVMKDVQLSAGYSVMLKTSDRPYLYALKGGNPNNWQDFGWLSIRISPQLFITHW